MSLNQGFVLYLPLWSTTLQGTNLISKDNYQHSCSVTGATYGVEGRTFDGTDDYIDCGRDSSILLTGDFTILAWIDLVDYTSYHYVIGQNAASGVSGFFSLMIQATTGIIYALRGNGTTEGSAWTGTNAIGLGKTSIAFTVASTTATSYINGNQDKSAAITGTPGDAGTNLRIGRRQDNYAPLDGMIGEVLVYNRELNSTEVTQIHNLTSPNYSGIKPRYGIIGDTKWDFFTWA